MTLRGQDIYYWVLGTYTGSSDGKNTTASWSNEGKQTYGGFEAPAWEALQLRQMVELVRKDHDTSAFYPQALEIARRDDPDYDAGLRPFAIKETAINSLLHLRGVICSHSIRHCGQCGLVKTSYATFRSTNQRPRLQPTTVAALSKKR